MFEKSFWAILIAMLLFSVLEVLFQGVIPAIMTEAFPAKVRYTGLSVSYNIALVLFGGTTPLVSVWLIKISGGNVWMPVYYLIASCMVAIITLFFMPETYKKELD